MHYSIARLQGPLSTHQAMVMEETWLALLKSDQSLREELSSDFCMSKATLQRKFNMSLRPL